MLTGFRARDILSIHDFSKDDILFLLEQSRAMKREAPADLLRGCLLASCFFEPSTRTRLSFETAMKRLGGEVIGFAESSSSAAAKGESLADSARIIGQYADLLVVRHPLEGASRLFAEATDKPVINAGDGSNQHPTQTLLDLFTIDECQGQIEGLHIAMMGDLCYGRTVHSLAMAATHFNARLYFVAPPGLEMPDSICDSLRERGLRFSFHQSLEEVIGKIDILYVTRLQKERLPMDFSTDGYRVDPGLLERAQPHMRILHPLPRVDELPTAVDGTPHAYYFEQAANGLYVRQALLASLLERI